MLEQKIYALLHWEDKGPRQVMEDYVRGDEKARDAVTEFVNLLSLTVANLVSVLNPETVVIGGSIAQWMEPVLPAIRAIVSSMTPIGTQVVLGSLGPWAAAIGAVYGALSHTENENRK